VIVDEGDHGFDRRSSSAIAKYADALRRISLAWRSSRTSRSSVLIRSRSSVVVPSRWPASRSACRTHFRRGEPEPAADAPPAADLTALLRACLTLLELPAWERVYRSNPPPLWRVPDALAQMRRLLAAKPQGAALETFLPSGEGQGPTAQLQRRAAIASTLVAGLELCRDGAAMLNQHAAFSGIVVRSGEATGIPAVRDAAA
jgi:chromatin segregation and condensation protein Rec8/ScpA/Scc1 (kleisin family)